MSALANLGSRLTDSLAPATQRWHRLETHQRRVFGGVAGLVALALLLAYVWLPAVRERDRLTERLPRLAVQLALMQRQADEIRQLTSTSPIAPAPPAVADAATLQSSFSDGARASVEANHAFRVVIPRIAYALWWDRLGDVQSRHQLQLVSLSLRSLPGGSREVSIDMLLADRARGGSAPSSGNRK